MRVQLHCVVPMTRIERVTSPLPRECSTTEPHGRRARRRIGTAPWTKTGAGEGNRTLVLSLEGFSSTIELHPPACRTPQLASISCTAGLLSSGRTTRDGSASPAASTVPASRVPRKRPGGGGWIRTSVGVSQQIYSLPPLATRAPLRAENRKLCGAACGLSNREGRATRRNAGRRRPAIRRTAPARDRKQRPRSGTGGLVNDFIVAPRRVSSTPGPRLNPARRS